MVHYKLFSDEFDTRISQLNPWVQGTVFWQVHNTAYAHNRLTYQGFI